MNPCFPAQLKEFPFTVEETKAVWEHAKREYIDKGFGFEETLKKTSDDLGIPERFVAQAFTKPKALRNISSDMFRKMALRKDAIRQAKLVVRSLDQPRTARIIQRIWNIPRSILTFGHYAVFPITHGGDLAFRPTAWGTYFKGVFDAYKFVGKATHEAAMQELVRSPNYTIARRGGLINAPEAEPQGILSSMSGPSRRGFDALKITRQALFDKTWDKLSPADQTLDMSKHLSEMVNHSTGAVSGQVPFAKFQFAPQLTASKWARAIGDPMKTLNTFSNWKNASAAERTIALTRVKHAAEFAATYASLLAVNEGLNQAMGSKDKVNFKDPTKSDWLQFKINGHIIGMGSGVREVYALLGKLVGIGFQTRKERHGDSASAAAAKTIGRYATYKLEPMSGNILEALMQEDRVTGRPLPFSHERGTKKSPKLTWTEYALLHGPIPLSGGAREAYDSMREQGMSALDATSLLKAAGVTAMESTGLRFHEYNDHRKPKTLAEALRDGQ